MLGTYNNGQARITIKVSGISEVPQSINAIIDTGFNGYLKLPFKEALPLGLVLTAVQEDMIGDGSMVSNLVCKGRVCLDDGTCVNTTIDIHKANIILIGTQLLRDLGKKLTIDCSTGFVELS